MAMGQANDRIHQCASLYGTEGTAARVPFIMERTVDSVRAAFLSKGATAFPPQGGLSVVSAMREARRQTPTHHGHQPPPLILFALLLLSLV